MTSDELKVKSYKDLLVWQKGIALVGKIHEITSGFPANEKYGLMSQMRRAAVSVPSNIAEGQARYTTGEFIHFVSNAEGSLAELETQLIVAIEVHYCTEQGISDTLGLVVELRKMLNSLRRILVTRH